MASPHPARSTPQPADPLASLPRLDRHKPKCGPVRPSRVGRWRASVLVLVHVVILLHVWHWLQRGSTLTPVEPSEAMQTFELGRINAGFLLFAGLILSTLVFGRWFCGWACHVVALQDLCAWLLGRLGLRPRPVRSRLLVLAPWVVAGHMFLWPWLERLWRVDLPPLPSPSEWQLALRTEQFWATFPGPLMGVLTLLVVGFLIVWWLGAKGFCTYGCPYGAFFAVADRFAPGRILVTDACDACGHCTSVCSSNVRVHEEVARHGRIVDPGCMKCLDCVSVCPKDALYFGFAAPRPLVLSQQRIAARGDFTWPEEIALGLLAWISAQWVFRRAWFGEGVPFLLSVGLGVITAVCALLWWRLLRKPAVTFQHRVWKQDGAWTRAGRVGFAALTVWLLFTGYTGFGKWLYARAEAAAATVARPELGDAERQAALRATADGFAAVARWWLVPDPYVHQMQGLALRQLGDFASAERQLRRALELDPDRSDAVIPLCDLLNLRGAVGEAERLLRRQLELRPDLQQARARLELLEQRRRQGGR